MGVAVSKVSIGGTDTELFEVFKFLEKQMVNYPKNVALMKYDIQKKNRDPLTYDALNGLSTKCAVALLHLVKSQERRIPVFIVGASAYPSIVIILLGIWKAGGAYLFIDTSSDAENVKQILKDVNPIYVLYDEDFSALFESVDSQYKISITNLMITINKMQLESLNGLNLLTQQNMDNVACIFYTSGHTKQAKAVKLTHRDITYHIAKEWQAVPYTGKEKYVLCHALLSSVASISELWAPLLTGLTVTLLPSNTIYRTERLIGILDEYNISRFYTYPSILQSILDHIQNMKGSKKYTVVRSVKVWMCSGEPLTIQHVKSFYNHFDEKSFQLYNVYGCTETGGGISYFYCSPELPNIFESVPIGAQPEQDDIFYVADENLALATEGQKGQLCVSGKSIAKYVSQDITDICPNTLNQTKLHEHLFLTGDNVLYKNGFFFYVGRRDSEISFEGKVSNMDEVENFLSNLPYVAKAATVPYDRSSEKKILAFLKLKPNSAIHTKRHVESLLKKEFDVRIEVILIDKVLTTANGKVDRLSYVKCYEEVEETTKTIHSKRDDDLNKRKAVQIDDILGVVAKVLNQPTSSVSLDMNFFNLGGSSKQALEAIRGLNEKGYSISINEFADCNSLRDLIPEMGPSVSRQRKAEVRLKIINFDDQNANEILRFARKVIEFKSLELAKYLEPEKFTTEFGIHLWNIWKDLKEFSFVVQDLSSSSFIGISLNVKNEFFPEIAMTHSIATLFRFYEHLLSSLRDHFFSRGNHQIMLNFLDATSANLPPAMNLACLQFIEEEKVRKAESKRYTNILSINTNCLRQTLLTGFFAYKTLLHFCVNTYEAADETKPFIEAPDELEAIVQWKILTSSGI